MITIVFLSKLIYSNVKTEHIYKRLPFSNLYNSANVLKYALISCADKMFEIQDGLNLFINIHKLIVFKIQL